MRSNTNYNIRDSDDGKIAESITLVQWTVTVGPTSYVSTDANKDTNNNANEKTSATKSIWRYITGRPLIEAPEWSVLHLESR